MLPNDKTIAQFASFLPAEASYQEAVLDEEADIEGEESYYDDEDDGSDNDSDPDNDD